MILVNVLLFVAIASGIVMLMITAEDGALQRGIRMREAGRAQAVMRGGELSAIVALRRDALFGAESDNLAEPWAALAERAAPIEGGSFDLAIADAQGRFNVNALMSGDAAAVETLARIAEALELPPELVPQATELVRLAGPVSDLRPLRLAAIEPEKLARLSQLITALPRETPVNVNSASEELLAILLRDPMAARALVVQRSRAGYLTRADFAAVKAMVPPGAGFTSDYFWVRARVAIGDTSQQLTSLLSRRRAPDRSVKVMAVARWRGSAPPEQAPPLPL